MIKPVRDFKSLQFLKRDILARERIHLLDATHLTFIQAISPPTSDDGQRFGWTRARNALRAYQPGSSFEDIRNGVKRVFQQQQRAQYKDQNPKFALFLGRIEKEVKQVFIEYKEMPHKLNFTATAATVSTICMAICNNK